MSISLESQLLEELGTWLDQHTPIVPPVLREPKNITLLSSLDHRLDSVGCTLYSPEFRY